MGIVESETASFAQLKGVKEIVAGIGGLEIGIRRGIGESGDMKDSETIGNSGSVCMDIDAEEDRGIIGEFVWTKLEVVGSVWVVTLTFDARADSQRPRSSRIPAENPSSNAVSLDSCTRSAKSLEASRRRSSYCALSISIVSAKSNW